MSTFNSRCFNPNYSTHRTDISGSTSASQPLPYACNNVITQGNGKKKRGGIAPPLYCDGNMIAGRFFFSCRFTVQKPLNVAFFELEPCLSLQVRRLLYWSYLSLFHKRIEGRTTNSKPLQDLPRTQQSVTHTKPLSWFTSFTKLTMLTSTCQGAILILQV